MNVNITTQAIIVKARRERKTPGRVVSLWLLFHALYILLGFVLFTPFFQPSLPVSFYFAPSLFFSVKC